MSLQSTLDDDFLQVAFIAFLRGTLIGPAILNSYRAYNDWRESSKNKDVRKGKEIVIDGEEWEIPSVPQDNVIEAKN